MIGAVEALYAEQPHQAWSAGVLEAFLPIVDGGFGVLVHELERLEDGSAGERQGSCRLGLMQQPSLQRGAADA